MDRGAWQAAVHRLAHSWTQLKQLHAQEAHSCILAVWELENAWKTFKIIEGLFVKWTWQKVSIYNLQEGISVSYTGSFRGNTLLQVIISIDLVYKSITSVYKSIMFLIKAMQ